MALVHAGQALPGYAPPMERIARGLVVAGLTFLVLMIALVLWLALGEFFDH